MGFIESNISQSDDGSYGLNEEDLKEIKEYLSERERTKFAGLLEALEQGLKQEDGSVSFAMGQSFRVTRLKNRMAK